VVASAGEQDGALERLSCRVRAFDSLSPVPKSEWYPGRFFVLDQAPDTRLSGAPIFDRFERVVGMLCTGGWVLKSDFLVDAILDCTERPSNALF
jgi:hypothetical protein